MKNVSKKKSYLLLAGVFAVVGLVIPAVSFYATYPTDAHILVERDRRAAEQQAYKADDPQKYFESEEYTQTVENQEASYSSTVGIISGVVSMVAWVLSVVWGYLYIRKHRINQHPIWTVVGLNVLFTLLVSPLLYLFDQRLTGTADNPYTVFFIAGAIVGLPLAAGLTAIVAKLTEYFYNRSHGFTAD